MKTSLLALVMFCCFPAIGREVKPSNAFSIAGLVLHPRSITTTDLQHMPQDTLRGVTIRNHRGEMKESIKAMTGTRLRTLLDSAVIVAAKPKEYGQYIIVLTATDGYTNVYTWNELYNTSIGDSVYIVTTANGKSIDQLTDRISVISLADVNTGSRHLKGLVKVEVRKVE